MPDTNPTKYTTKQVADKLKLTTNTIRNWTVEYPDHLSLSARPGAQPERRFVEKDLTVLSYIKKLKDEGMREADVRQRLSETTFTDTEVLEPAPAPADTETQPPAPAQQAELAANQAQLAENAQGFAPPAAQEARGEALALALVQDTINARFAALERAGVAQDERIKDWGSRRQSIAMAYVLGLTSGLVLAFALLAIAIWIWR